MDDWYLIWYKHLFGAWQFPAYFSLDRPLMGYFFIFSSYLLGNTESPLVWQIFGLFTRWLVVYALWGFLNTMWPQAKKTNTYVSLLAVVFPGFTQQWIAFSYSFHFSCLAGFLFSLTLMVKAIRSSKYFWIFLPLSLLIGFYSYAASEFYFGLELIRPVVLFIEYHHSDEGIKKSLLKTFKTWIPFFILFLAFGIWRAFFYVSQNHSVTITRQLVSSPGLAFLAFVKSVYQGFINSVVLGWVNAFKLDHYPTQGKTLLLALGLFIFLVLILILWLGRVQKNSEKTLAGQDRKYIVEVLCLGLCSILFAALPFAAAGLEISLDSLYDRFLLAFLFGSCLLLGFLLSRIPHVSLYFVAILVAVSACYQMVISVRYKNVWSQQANFFQQLVWRAPHLKPGTILITDDVPFSKYYAMTSLTAALNMIYAEDQNSHDIPYLLILHSFEPDFIADYSQGQEVKFDFRTFSFSSDTSSLLFFTYPGNGCLRIVAPEDSMEAFRESDWNVYWRNTMNASNLDQIVTSSNDPVTLPRRFFGEENTNQWCFYYEKADLARREKDWEKIIELYQTAGTAGFEPKIDVEWVPLLDAYIHTNQLDQAMTLTQGIENLNTANTADLCKIWRDHQDDPDKQAYARDALTVLKCDGIQ